MYDGFSPLRIASAHSRPVVLVLATLLHALLVLHLLAALVRLRALQNRSCSCLSYRWHVKSPSTRSIRLNPFLYNRPFTQIIPLRVHNVDSTERRSHDLLPRHPPNIIRYLSQSAAPACMPFIFK